MYCTGSKSNKTGVNSIEKGSVFPSSHFFTFKEMQEDELHQFGR
jgi:hypothetical protein